MRYETAASHGIVRAPFALALSCHCGTIFYKKKGIEENGMANAMPFP